MLTSTPHHQVYDIGAIEHAHGRAVRADHAQRLDGLAEKRRGFGHRRADRNRHAIDLPRPLVTGHNARPGADFSFSGLKTALRLAVQQQPELSVEDATASFQAAVIDILADRTAAAMAMFRRDFPQAAQNVLVVAGGVAANQAIGAALDRLAGDQGFVVKIPPPRLCTDNAAMIAWAGLEMLAQEEPAQAGQMLSQALAVSPRARWPLASAPEAETGNPLRR